MFKIHRKSHIGNIDYGWINIQHHFSFGHYFDKKRDGIGPLRVLNVETIQPGSGYEEHEHRDMEIITYVYQGHLSYQDAFGNTGNLQAGSVQYLSAGTGIAHKEENDKDEVLKLVQIWVEPNERNTEPYYTNMTFPKEVRLNKPIKVVSDTRSDGKIHIKQKLNIYILELDEEHYKAFELRGASELYCVQIDGESYVNGNHIYNGDAFHATETVHIQPITHAHYIIIEIY